MLIIMTYYRLIERKNIVLIASLGVMVAILFHTQTRSAIYGLIPSIALVHLFFVRKNVKDLIRITSLLAITLSVVILFSGFIEKNFYRVTTPFDATVIERLQTNYYATIGVWKEAPLFGIRKEMAWDVISHTAREEGPIFGDIFRVTTTHHNQILYYFRYYGLIGLGLLIALYWMIFRKIGHSPNNITKMMLLSIFIFDFQYSIGHNNKLISNVLLWLLLSITAFTRETGDE